MDVADKMDSLYSELPTLECQGKCQESCGPVFMSRLEWDRIKSALGWVPRGGKSLTCPMLHRGSGKCRVYEIRPMICRLWGIVESMPCLWGCKPSHNLTDREGHEFLRRADELGV